MTIGKKQIFYIACITHNGSGDYNEMPIEGRLLAYTHFGFFFFLHKNESSDLSAEWCISEVTTGFRVSYGQTIKAAEVELKKIIVEVGEKKFKSIINKVIKKYGTINRLPNEPKKKS